MGLSLPIAGIRNRKAPEVTLRGFSSCYMEALTSFFAYWHYSICRKALQYPGKYLVFFVNYNFKFYPYTSYVELSLSHERFTLSHTY